MKRVYNESSEIYSLPPASSSTPATNPLATSLGNGKYMSEHDLGRRRALEREYESDEKSVKEWNAIFDESGNFLVRDHPPFLLHAEISLAIFNLERNQGRQCSLEPCFSHYRLF